MEAIRRVSIIVPMLNESERVEQLVSDIAAQDFAGEIELFVADGRSTDGSVQRLTAAADRAGLAPIVIENPERLVAPGLNACIERATGDIIIRLDCKARYPRDYVSNCVRAAEETGAWNVGGILVPEGHTPMERAVACALESPFGGISWSRHWNASERVEVDTVYCGAFRPEAFTHAGLYDKSTGPSHDEELNLRLRHAGGRIVLDPAIRTYYRAHGSIPEVFAKYYHYGVWKVPVMLRHGRILSARSLAPIAFIPSLVGLGVLARRSPGARRLLAAELSLYAACALAFGVASVRRREESWRLLPRVVAVFPAFHVGYGLGMVHGFCRAALTRAFASARSFETTEESGSEPLATSPRTRGDHYVAARDPRGSRRERV